jgi:hypothetical protein
MWKWLPSIPNSSLRTSSSYAPSLRINRGDPVRIDPELWAAIEARAVAEHTTTSEIIRRAIRRFFDVA